MKQQPLPKQRRPVEVSFPTHQLAVIESHHHETFWMDWRRDDFHKILVLLEGRGTLFYAEEQLVLKGACILIIPARLRHRIVDERPEPLSLYGLCLNGPPFPDASLIQAACSELARLENPDLVSRAIVTMRRLAYEQRTGGQGSADLQLSLTTQFLVELVRFGPGQGNGAHSSAMDRVKLYLREMEQTFWMTDNVDDVARRLGLSRRRFTGLFRKLTGTSWLQYLHTLRMRHAKRLLQDTGLPVKAIAFECGYGDLTHFYRVFKQHFGHSPSLERKPLE